MSSNAYLLMYLRQALDLSAEEYAAFASGIADMAAERERNPSDFQQFQVPSNPSLLHALALCML